MDEENLYPQILSEEEVLNKLNEKLASHDNKEINTIRINTIKGFIDELKRDYLKYSKKKKYHTFNKNILSIFDLVFGSVLTLSGIILEVVTFGLSTSISIILGSIGMIFVTSLPLTHKIINKYENKNRNLQILSTNNLNKIILIFSKAMKDDFISHDEYEYVIKIKESYYHAKMELKSKNKKQINEMINNNNDIKQIDIEKIKREVDKISKKELSLEIKKELIMKKKMEIKSQINL